MRKRTIAARVEKLWTLTGYERKYPVRGAQYRLKLHVRDVSKSLYILTHRDAVLTKMAKMAREGAPGATETINTLTRYGWPWADAHEYAHGLDWGLHKCALHKGEAFVAAVEADGDKAIRSGYSDPNVFMGYSEMFADAIAYTVVNAREFIHEHPAKYAYARGFLKEQGVI